MKVLLLCLALIGCTASTREATLSYTLSSVTAISGQITEANDKLVQAAIADHADSEPAGLAKLATYRRIRDKTKASVKLALDALSDAYRLNDGPSLTKATNALATLLADLAAMKGAE